jgi:hypothetical protein
MSTRTVQLNCNTRPVRLAFLVATPDPATLETVFKLNTLLWGGMLNPVVVLDGSTRKQVGDYYTFDNLTYEQEQLGLVKSFDPDLVINCANSPLPAFLAPFRERTFPLDVMRWNPWGTYETMAFLEVWPFLEQHWRKEVRFLPEPREKFGYIDLDGLGVPKTFLVARFGSYPENTNGNKILADNFGGKLVTYDHDFRRSFSPDEWVFPIHITAQQLEVPMPHVLDGYILFLLDPENMFDIVDYWNLRAAGYRVFALPTTHYHEFSQSAKLFAERSVYPINPNVTTCPEVVKARSVDDLCWTEAGRWFQGLGISADRLSLKGWVPRFRPWDRDRRVMPEMQIRSPISVERNEIVVFTDGHGTLQLNPPDFELRGLYLSQHWAVEFQAMGTADEDGTFRLPWLHPECDALANRRVGHHFKPYSSRVTQHGISLLETGDRENVWIHQPTVTEVLSAYLRNAGFTYLNTSNPGRTLERIVEQLDGLSQCAVFQNSGVREVIDTLAHGSNMPYIWVKQAIYRALPAEGEEKRKRFERILSKLVATKVLRQGFELQCERCRQYDWYHVSDLNDDFRCKKCFRVQQVPHLHGGDWRYVVDGLFRLKGKVAGCFTTILALLFLKHFVGSSDSKYISSFDYSDGTNHGERDFALLVSEFLHEDVDVVIGECKSLREMEENQRQAIRHLGETTGTYLAFCTLSEAFAADDKLFFEQLVVGRQKLILLTRKHLEMPHSDIDNYRHEKHWIGRATELISRLTTKEVLGNKFADEHRLYI